MDRVLKKFEAIIVAIALIIGGVVSNCGSVNAMMYDSTQNFPVLKDVPIKSISMNSDWAEIVVDLSMGWAGMLDIDLGKEGNRAGTATVTYDSSADKYIYMRSNIVSENGMISFTCLKGTDKDGVEITVVFSGGDLSSPVKVPVRIIAVDPAKLKRVERSSLVIQNPPAPLENIFLDWALVQTVANELGIDDVSENVTTEQLGGITHLNGRYSYLKDLDGIRNLPNLTELNLEFNNIQDISELSSLRKLNSIDLDDNVIRDLSPLFKLPNLTYLSLNGNDVGADINSIGKQLSGLSLTHLSLAHNFIEDISPLSGMTGLTSLNLYNNDVEDISALSGLTGLTYLNLSDNDVKDILPLSDMTGLTSLNLYNNDVKDISPLSGMTSLTYLNLFNNDVKDISLLSDMTGLTSLNLYNNDIEDISALSGLTSLNSLNMDSNNISDLSSLSGLTSLTELDLDYNNISDITPLSGLSLLVSLGLGNNNISDISPVSGLSPLTSLELRNNNISDISHLSEMNSLTMLGLDNNKIEDISALSGLVGLEALYLTDNYINDISAVSDLANLSFLYINNQTIQIPESETTKSDKGGIVISNPIRDLAGDIVAPNEPIYGNGRYDKDSNTIIWPVDAASQDIQWDFEKKFEMGSNYTFFTGNVKLQYTIKEILAYGRSTTGKGVLVITFDQEMDKSSGVVTLFGKPLPGAWGLESNSYTAFCPKLYDGKEYTAELKDFKVAKSEEGIRNTYFTFSTDTFFYYKPLSEILKSN